LPRALRKVMAMGGGHSQNVGPDDSLVQPRILGMSHTLRLCPTQNMSVLA